MRFLGPTFSSYRHTTKDLKDMVCFLNNHNGKGIDVDYCVHLDRLVTCHSEEAQATIFGQVLADAVAEGVCTMSSLDFVREYMEVFHHGKRETK